MAKGLRACPICPACGAKKFRIVGRNGSTVTVECLSCSRQTTV